MIKQNYQKLVETTEFTRMWAEGYTCTDVISCLSIDFMFLDDDMNSICTLTEDDVKTAFAYLNTQMKNHFLTVYQLKS